MGYDLHANNPTLPPFHMGMAWTYLLEQSGAYFPCVSQGARWYMLFDERMTMHFHDTNDDGERQQVIDQSYPAILCNCGFAVTEEESRVLARIARNTVAIQHTLMEPTQAEYERSFHQPAYQQPFPCWIRRDWVECFERFAEWAEQSHGFKVF